MEENKKECRMTRKNGTVRNIVTGVAIAASLACGYAIGSNVAKKQILDCLGIMCVATPELKPMIIESIEKAKDILNG